jgi:hypothetical protein
MKKRLGFISNSSSSSFVCDCGHGITWYDGETLEDYGVKKCENGHYFCSDCGSELNTNDHFVEVNQDEEEDYFSLLLKKEYCPYCTLEKISDFDLKLFLFKKYSLNEKSILKEIKTVFKNYENFKEYINRV